MVFLFAGPDAVKYVVNHADMQAIFCVPQTLNSVSLTFASLVVSDITSVSFTIEF